jgi:hypothetical protein
LSRPQNTSGSPIDLLAFNPDAGSSVLKPLFVAAAGAWPNLGGNSNLVPVVANGQVYVASNKQLRIFGPIAAAPKN